MPFQAVFASPIVFAVLCAVAVPLILFRLFGVLFFASTISGWAVIPAITLGTLIAVYPLPRPMRRGVAAIGLVLYGCSLYFHGWGNLADRLAEGGTLVFEALEATILVALALRCFAAR